MKTSLQIIAVIIYLFLCLTGCRKFLTIDHPKTEIDASYIFSNNQTATNALTGIYDNIMKSFSFLNGYMTKYPALLSDEINIVTLNSTESIFNNNELTSRENIVSEVWVSGYFYIGQANNIIEGLAKSTTISNNVKTELTGQAKFIRAFVYFYLVNLYGGVPLVTTTNIQANTMLPRATTEEIYELIISDLTDAVNQLTVDYFKPGSSSGRILPNKWAAAAMLARVYLYRNEWQEADAYASQVINSGMYELATDLQTVFLAGSNEAILQLKPVEEEYNTAEGSFFVQPDPALKPIYILNPTLDSTFEKDDKRRTWVNERIINNQTYHSPFKYRVYKSPLPYTEYNMALRLAEQYLIRSEARAQVGNTIGSIADINVIRLRAGLPELSRQLTNSQVLSALEHERRIELFAEWGHRWFDLKRWPDIQSPADSSKKRSDEVLGSLKKGTWQSTDILWPIPDGEIKRNSNLTQNPGYL